MAYTTADLDAIQAALSREELTVSWDGKTVTYRSTRELERIRDIILADLRRSGQLAQPHRCSYVSRRRT